MTNTLNLRKTLTMGVAVLMVASLVYVALAATVTLSLVVGASGSFSAGGATVTAKRVSPGLVNYSVVSGTVSLDDLSYVSSLTVAGSEAPPSGKLLFVKDASDNKFQLDITYSPASDVVRTITIVITAIVADADGDTILNDADLCSGTVSDAGDPSDPVEFPNHSKYLAGNTHFATRLPDKSTSFAVYSIASTGGCSSTQLLQRQGVDATSALYQKGTPKGHIEQWISDVAAGLVSPL